jgi:N,N'-diacetyllegionaminate synthase
MKIIAEIGWNHLGSMYLAEKMIVAASKSGADFCKFQTWSESYLKKGPWDKDGRRQIYKKAQLSYEDHIFLKKVCKKNNVEFLTTVFNINDVDWLSRINPDFIKIGSPEIYNVELIQKCLKKFKNIFLSTGASKWNELQKLKKLKMKNKLVLFHNVSSYPCEVENINMPKIKHLKKISKRIGYSGHLNGVNDAIFAICKGAEYIEKHFTINQNLPGRDNKFSILPKDLKLISNFRNDYLKMNKFKGLNLQNCEKDTFHLARGRWSK